MFVKLFQIISDYVNTYNWNKKLFIKEFSLEYSGKINSYDEITDILDSTINEYVLTNTYESNKEIIIKYYGNIESAIIIYNSVIGILQYSTIEYIYSQLAFLSIFINIYPKIIESIISTILVFISAKNCHKPKKLRNKILCTVIALSHRAFAQ